MGKKLRNLSILLTALILTTVICGCSGSTKNLQLDRYLATGEAQLIPVPFGDETVYEYNTGNASIRTNVFGYQGLIIAPIQIKNLTNEDLAAKDYSINLYDGKDRLAVKMLSKADLIQIEAKLSNPASVNILNPTIQGAVSAVDSLLKFPGNSSISSNLNNAIEKYFEFRPVYAGATRTGFLAFFHDFRLEYPLTLELTIKNKKYSFFFNPEKPTP